MDKNINNGTMVGRIGTKEEIPLKKRKKIKIRTIKLFRFFGKRRSTAIISIAPIKSKDNIN